MSSPREGTVVNAKPGGLTAAAPSITGTMVIECVTLSYRRLFRIVPSRLTAKRCI